MKCVISNQCKKKKLVNSCLGLLFLLFVSNYLIAQGVQSERPSGSTAAYWGYYEYLPTGYKDNPDQKHPVILFLHGIGEAGNGTSELNRVLKSGPPNLINKGQWPEDRPFIVISPQSYGGFFNADKLHNFIDYINDTYRTDKNRVYITGLSAGGMSTWNYLAAHQDQVAAAIPIAGKGQNAIKNAGCAFKNIPIWAFHGSNDGTVKVNGSIVPVEEINSCSPKPSPLAKVTVYPGVGHNSWSRTYDLSGMNQSTDAKYDPFDMDIYQWLLQYSRGGETPNQTPTANAGKDINIQLPTSTDITISGSGIDPDGNIVSFQWTQVSGPAQLSLTGAKSKQVVVNELIAGTYNLKLTVTDNDGATASDNVKIIVTEIPNESPVVDAGNPVEATMPIDNVLLTGNVEDKDGEIISYEWEQIDGPSSQILPSGVNCEVSGLTEGEYTFALTVTDDDGAQTSDQVKVTVRAETSTSPPPATADCNCDHVITPEKDFINGDGLNIQPGDVICIQAGKYRSLNLFNFQGSAQNPITFINCGGQVIIGDPDWHYGFVMNNNRYFRLTGTGDPNFEYGIKIDNTHSSGLAISTRSSDYEIDHLEISNTGFAGMHLLTSPKCDPSTWRENFTMKNISIHDNYVHDTHGEGFYIGHSKYNGQTITCDGQKITVLPHVIKNIKVFNNTIKNTGWDGFQVSCAIENCDIFNNSVSNTGIEGKNTQSAGIVIGGGTAARLYNNVVTHGNGAGIHVFGLGNTQIFNNVVYDVVGDGIFIGEKSTVKGWAFEIINNTIVKTGRDGIRMYNELSRNNKFFNNLILNPASINDYSNEDKAYIYFLPRIPTENHQIANNYTHKSIDNAKFVNVGNKDFRLQAASPAMDKGRDVSGLGINKDALNVSRPQGGAFDAGAFEFKSGQTNSNKPPIANAGQDLKVELPIDSITIVGSGKDVDGQVFSYEWTQEDGPTEALMNHVKSNKVTVCKLVEGSYTFRLTVMDDDGATAFDEVTIVGKVPNQMPMAEAGDDKEVPMPVDTITLTGKGEDSDGDIVSYQWSQTAGNPADIQFGDSSACILNGLSEGEYTFQLSVTDNEGAEASDEITISVKPNPNMIPGVVYKYYEGTWDALPDFSKQTPVKEGITSNFDLSSRAKNDLFGFTFEALIDIAETGTYTFYTASDDGSVLLINDKIVVDNDGLHPLREKSGTISLDKGKHSIKVAFFEKKGRETLNASYAGPNFDKMLIPDEVLYLPEAELPTPNGSTHVFINFSNTKNAPAPWNNTAGDPRYEKEFSNMLDKNANETGINLTILTPWGQGYPGSYNTKGVITGNETGVYPDSVMKTAYWIGTDKTESLKVDGLTPFVEYEFTFFASRDGGGNRVTNYSIGNEVVSLDAANNTKKTVAITAFADENGEVLINIQKDVNSKYGYLNALVIKSDNHRVISNEKVLNEDGQNTDQELTVEAYPNPVESYLNVKLTKTNESFAIISLVDMSGGVLYKEEYNLNNTPFEYQLNLTQLSLQPGIYILHVQYSNSYEMLKLYKQ